MTTGGTARAALHTIITAIAITGALTLAGCSSTSTDASTTKSTTAETPSEETVEEPAAPLDLMGEWKQTNFEGDAYMVATIDAATITAQYVNAEEDTTALFWAGSYVAPTAGADAYSWDSVNDTEQTSKSLLASPDPTKTFEYADGVLSFPMSLMGVTKTIKLERQ
jgi:hypothetical protein